MHTISFIFCTLRTFSFKAPSESEIMKVYENDTVVVFFGDRHTSVHPDQVRGSSFEILRDLDSFKRIQGALPSVSGIVTAHQVHGVAGVTINEESRNLPFFTHEGDYLITDLPSVGLAIATADCLPIVFYDPVHHVVVAVHAGWRGLVGGVVENALADLKARYGSMRADRYCIVGPSAKSCCYEVGSDFIEQACALFPSRRMLLEKTVEQRKNNKYFFDTLGFLRLLLFENGFSEPFFDISYNECTICNDRYCSYRREKMSPLRQLTVVSLK